MNKIPVARTISSAYGFTFGHVGTVIGLIWLPLVVYYVGRFFIVNYAQSIAASSDPSSGGRAALVLIGFWFLSVFFTAIIGVAVTRQAMNPKQGNIILNFGFGQAELNYFLALLAVFAVMVLVYIAVVILAAVAGGAAGTAAGAADGGAKKWLVSSIIVVVVVAAAAALVYVGVRLVYLVAPVTVSESKIDLTRAWQLSRGNFWRMLAILLVTIGPIVIISQLAFAAIVGRAYVAALFSVFVGILQAIAAGVTPPTQLIQHLPDISSKTPLLLGLGFLLAPFTYGLMFSAPAFAYRELVGTPPPSSAPDIGPFKAA
jgi:hypothetical protein